MATKSPASRRMLYTFVDVQRKKKAPDQLSVVYLLAGVTQEEDITVNILCCNFCKYFLTVIVIVWTIPCVICNEMTLFNIK